MSSPKKPRSCKTPAFWSKGCEHRIRLQRLVALLDELFGLSLPFPVFRLSESDVLLKKLKGFCSAPLERKSHLWDVSLQRLGKRSRFSVYMSLFLFRKTLPATAPHHHEFFDKITSESPDPDPAFMDYLRYQVPKIFKMGWDARYLKKVKVSIPSSSSCAEVPRSKGGSRTFWFQNKDPREYFESICLGEVDVNELFDEHVAEGHGVSILKDIVTAGKVRLITVPTAFQQVLDPLHKIMYDHLSKKNWLLRGDAKADKFKDFTKKEGEVFVSGDYESATDNLNSKVQKEILRLILQQCEVVPNSIRRFAMRTLSSDIRDEDDHGRSRGGPIIYHQTHGQMMGYKLSFPLLCLVNYLSFKFAVRGHGKFPLKINGDDIVFRAPRDVADLWIRSVGVAGLKLSVGKTLVDPSVFTLNSTLFGAGLHKVKRIPIVRSTALFGRTDGETPLHSLSGRYKSAFPGFGQEKKTLLRKKFLRYNSGFVKMAKGSLNRRLNMDVPDYVLKGSALWLRECSYLSLPREERLWQCKPEGLNFVSQPEGYEIKWGESKHIYKEEEKNELVEAVVEAAWNPASKTISAANEYEGGFPFQAIPFKKCTRMLAGKGNFTNVHEQRRILALRNAEIFAEFRSRSFPRYPYWGKKEKKNNLSDIPNEMSDSTPVHPIELGPATVWFCEVTECKLGDPVVLSLRGRDFRIQPGVDQETAELKIVSPGAKLKVYKNGIGIGPPTCF